MIAQGFGAFVGCATPARSQAQQAAEIAAITAECKAQLALDGAEAGARDADLAACAARIDAWENEGAQGIKNGIPAP